MAKQQRPTLVTVIALINIFHGAMGLLWALMLIGLGLVDLTDLPWAMLFLLAGVLAAVQLVAGLGLLRMQPWARILCMIFSVLFLLYTVPPGIFVVLLEADEIGGWVVFHPVSILVLFALAYGIAMMVVLNLRNVRAAFAHAAVGTTNPGGLAARG
jgi:hypothetical protein